MTGAPTLNRSRVILTTFEVHQDDISRRLTKGEQGIEYLPHLHNRDAWPKEDKWERVGFYREAQVRRVDGVVAPTYKTLHAIVGRWRGAKFKVGVLP